MTLYRRFTILPAIVAGLLFSRPVAQAAPSATTKAPKETIQKITSIFENSTTALKYTYVENIGDQRGFTFGFPGFTSGTYDGTLFLKEYQRLNPKNKLIAFLPAFEAIDRGPHDSEGRNPSTQGLAEFPKTFAACGGDPAFVQAQHNLVDSLYWNPAQAMAADLGARHVITLGQLYDASINHGAEGAVKLAKQATQAAGGTPKSGVDETKWLDAFLAARLKMLQADKTWAESVDRVRVYQTLLREGNLRLALPITVSCYGDTFTLK